ncbi:calcium-binding protein [Actinoplanes regularis]|uniref:calcium-binding protein n=1 Tax=Actinoplanes regularis TaxID=52697 RepID=UPI0024A2C54F|nr:hypothetical protein [Actinoplanes regularis]GLW34651.1 hypothetical protein Areg01_75880 [Actinoplanes regularis]
MFLINRKTLSAIGAVAVAATATTLFASPVQAASAGTAQVLGVHNSIVQFTAAAGRANSLVVTVSGRTVTLDDTSAIKAGKGCKAVKGDRTKVRCTTSRKPTEIAVALGDKNDKVYNRTALMMMADGGSGSDLLSGGSVYDRLFGGSGDDKLYGNGALDGIDGGAGNDVIYGGSGNDWVLGEAGNDVIYGGSGNDNLSGMAGNDVLYGGSGNDDLSGGLGRDRISGGPGRDRIRA